MSFKVSMNGFWVLLGLLFIGLKLSGQIAWSWWLVLLPLYGPLVLLGVFFILMVIFALAVAVNDEVKKRNRRR